MAKSRFAIACFLWRRCRFAFSWFGRLFLRACLLVFGARRRLCVGFSFFRLCAVLFSKANKAFQYTQYTGYKGFTIMKHNISITMEQKLFREIENTRGREKRSTFIEHLIIMGLKSYITKNEELATKSRKPQLTALPT